MPPAVIDARALPPLERYPLILSTFDNLVPGQAFELINNHDPVPLYFRFRDVRPGLFDWHYVESGPGQWRVRIAKTACSNDETACACGGPHSAQRAPQPASLAR